MDDLFPLSFRKQEPKICRGLSVNQCKGRKELPNHYTDPRNIPARDPKYLVTVIFDLDQTLISADGVNGEDEDDDDTELVIRPYALDLLNVISRHKNVEFIVWTAATEAHTKRVIYSLDVHFDYIISRHKCWYHTDNPTKNLNLISNRPLDSLVLIDDRMDNGVKHPENMLIVPPFMPKEDNVDNDTTMLYLVNILYKAIDGYTKDPSKPFHSYIFSPLVDKCVYEGMYYYGVRCFSSKEELDSRVKSFKKYVV